MQQSKQKYYVTANQSDLTKNHDYIKKKIL